MWKVQYYSPYDFLNCEGANFSSSWREFRLKAVANINAGFQKDEQLLEEAKRIYQEFHPDATARSMKQVEVLLTSWPGRYFSMTSARRLLPKHQPKEIGSPSTHTRAWVLLSFMIIMGQKPRHPRLSSVVRKRMRLHGLPYSTLESFGIVRSSRKFPRW